MIQMVTHHLSEALDEEEAIQKHATDWVLSL